MNDQERNEDLFAFIQESASMFHTTAALRKRLLDAGFEELKEADDWKISEGGSYFTSRNGSSLLAFRVGSDLRDLHFQITAAHGDSPTYKVKAVPELEGPGEYLRLNVEGYGGMIDSTWFDRPLGLAGRVLVREGDRVLSRLLHIEDDVLLIPNVAIHMNRNINDGYHYNTQVDLLPLFSAGRLKKGDFDKMIAYYLDLDADQILAKDLFLVNHQAPSQWGYKKEFISTPKLDDLQCAYVSLEGFLAAKEPSSINVFCCFDNEEVGSNTKQGAMSTFLKDCLKRLLLSLGKQDQDYYRAVAKSFLISCDNAHAVHPNHGELTDKGNCSYLNKGIVVKEAANQKYTSDAFSQAIFRTICKEAEVPVQSFANRSDMRGGSTLGNLSNTQVSLHAVDIGLPQLAMHSSYETAGAKDTEYAVRALTCFFRGNLEIQEAEGFSFQAR